MEKEALVRGRKIIYFEEGEGFPIIIIHGWAPLPGSPQTRLRELLASRGYRVIFLILPGFGKGYFPSNGWGIEDYAECVLEFIKQKKIDEVFLLGHSMGGAISIRAALFQPEKIKALFLLSPAIFSLAGSNLKWCLFTIGFYSFLIILAVIKFTLLIFSAALRPFASFMRWIEKILHFTNDWLNRVTLQHQFYIQDKRRMRKVFKRIVKNENIVHYLSEIKQPVLAIWGEKDFNFYFSASFTGRIPNYKLKIIPNIGHNLPEDAPEKVVELITDFIKELEQK